MSESQTPKLSGKMSRVWSAVGYLAWIGLLTIGAVIFLLACAVMIVCLWRLLIEVAHV